MGWVLMAGSMAWLVLLNVCQSSRRLFLGFLDLFKISFLFVLYTENDQKLADVYIN